MAWRSDGQSGFLFISQHQPYEPLADVPPTGFEVSLDHETVTFPNDPVAIPSGTRARWPVAWQTAGGPTLRWATASLLSVLQSHHGPTLVLRTDAGITPTLCFQETVSITRGGDVLQARNGAWDLSVTDWDLFSVTVERTSLTLDVLVLSPQRAETTWVLDSPAGERLMLCTMDDLCFDSTGRLMARTVDTVSELQAWNPTSRVFQPTGETPPRPRSAPCRVEVLAPAKAVAAAGYGGLPHRPAAPNLDVVRSEGARWRIHLPDWAHHPHQGSVDQNITASSEHPQDGVLEICWAGDVAVLEVNGRLVADRFWDGTPWRIDLQTLQAGSTELSELTLTILPLHPQNPIGLSPSASRARASVDGDLISLDSITYRERLTWHPMPPQAPAR